MKILAKVLLLAVLYLIPNLALADPADNPAEAAVSCTVEDIMEWSAASFAEIAITPNITARAQTPSASQMLVLYTNGNVDITADITATAQLSNTDPNSSGTLVTEYKLTYDNDGTTATGGDTVDWTVHGSFLSSASVVTHYSADGNVEVTLWARASNVSGDVADAGTYNATQTLTAAWGTQ